MTAGPVRHAALFFHVSWPTAKRWAERYAAMGEAGMQDRSSRPHGSPNRTPHALAPLPTPGQDWRAWFVENTRSFRRTLLARRDGARLHAGSMPQGGDFERGVRKLAFLVDSGLPEADATTAMLASSRFTVGSVLEEQTEADRRATDALAPESARHAEAFEAGLRLILRGLE